MDLLEPDWNQPRPTLQEALSICSRIKLTHFEVQSEVVKRVLDCLCESHSNGGALLAATRVGPDEAFDWFASRNRLLEFDILPHLLRRKEVRESLPELMIPTTGDSLGQSVSCPISAAGGFKMESSFLFDGQLAQRLYMGGAYGQPRGDGKVSKELAIGFCDALFEQRFSEVHFFSSYDAWTPWFHQIAWDWTAILFDLRKRLLWILAVTDTD
ncbi:MAG TPA: hypothetical protein VN776_09255 [Terracidiphilus sp.]|nr:hypothetical protein [Terracidiphilus sp.]